MSNNYDIWDKLSSEDLEFNDIVYDDEPKVLGDDEGYVSLAELYKNYGEEIRNKGLVSVVKDLDVHTVVYDLDMDLVNNYLEPLAELYSKHMILAEGLDFDAFEKYTELIDEANQESILETGEDKETVYLKDYNLNFDINLGIERVRDEFLQTLIEIVEDKLSQGISVRQFSFDGVEKLPKQFNKIHDILAEINIKAVCLPDIEEQFNDKSVQFINIEDILPKEQILTLSSDLFLNDFKINQLEEYADNIYRLLKIKSDKDTVIMLEVNFLLPRHTKSLMIFAILSAKYNVNITSKYKNIVNKIQMYESLLYQNNKDILLGMKTPLTEELKAPKITMREALSYLKPNGLYVVATRGFDGWAPGEYFAVVRGVYDTFVQIESLTPRYSGEEKKKSVQVVKDTLDISELGTCQKALIPIGKIQGGKQIHNILSQYVENLAEFDDNPPIFLHELNLHGIIMNVDKKALPETQRLSANIYDIDI